MTRILLLPFLMISLIFSYCSQSATNVSQSNTKSSTQAVQIDKKNLAEATFGAGCFWCVEAVFEELQGVSSVESGYSGGTVKNPTYEQICTKTTGHAEVARIYYDPKIIGFDELLEVFWSTHDPTTLNQQGADKGPQYRSAIYYHDDDQKTLAEKSKAEVASELWDDPIVTEISPLINYYPAENYHQDYYDLNPNYGYCVAVINPKMAKFRKKFAHKLKGAAPQVATQSLEVLSKGNYNQLNEMEQYVIQQKGTERPFTGEYVTNKEKGTYICRQCNQPLFDSDAKFKSGTGWPSFDDIYADGAVLEVPDADGRRIEIICGNCDGHLGHVFKNEGFTEKQTRHCVNSVSLNFVPVTTN